ncbi:hypothetical protein ACOMHN_061977 [Nucella lapillus]
MIHLEVVGSRASPRANLLSRLGLLDSREGGGGGRLGTPSSAAVFPPAPSHHVPPVPRDARIIRIPSARRKGSSRLRTACDVADGQSAEDSL